MFDLRIIGTSMFIEKIPNHYFCILDYYFLYNVVIINQSINHLF